MSVSYPFEGTAAARRVSVHVLGETSSAQAQHRSPMFALEHAATKAVKTYDVKIQSGQPTRQALCRLVSNQRRTVANQIA